MLDGIATGGASGIMAARRAVRAVESGDADIVACIAGDTANATSFRDLLASFSVFSRDCVYPYGAGGPNASFALLTDHYMRRFGATREDFGHLAVTQRSNARDNPLALLREPMTMADYLAARPIVTPLHLLDCVLPCAGGDGFLVMTRARAASLGLASVRLLSSIERHNAFPDDPIQDRGGWVMDREALWSRAGVAPAEMDVVQTYDDYPVISMLQFEGLGFCPQGGAPAFLRERDLTVSGDLPHNTGGGQLSCGQAGAAGGYLGLVEALRQLTGQAASQVDRVRHALVSGFGMINYDRGLCTAAAVLAV
jgi:acetyl-CoA acetyltransferase